MKTLTDIIGIRWFNKLEELCKQALAKRIEDGSNVTFRNEEFECIERIGKKDICIKTREPFLNENLVEYITWEEIREARKNNRRKKFNFKWKKMS